MPAYTPTAAALAASSALRGAYDRAVRLRPGYVAAYAAARDAQGVAHRAGLVAAAARAEAARAPRGGDERRYAAGTLRAARAAVAAYAAAARKVAVVYARGY